MLQEWFLTELLENTMRNRLLSALALLLCTHAASQASVVYQWTAVGQALPHDITLSLEFSDAAVASGTASFHLKAYDYAASYPNSPLLSLSYSVPGVMPMQYSPVSEKFNGGLGRLDIDVSFTADGYLMGWIRANDANSDFEMRSTGTLMTVLGAHSDQGMGGAGCSFGSNCSGATGYLQRVALAQQAGGREAAVPEPGTLGLLAAGAAAIAALRRRKVRGLA